MSKTAQIMLVSLLATLLLATIGVLSLLRLEHISKLLDYDTPQSIEAIKKTSHLDGLAQFIRYYDEVLTQSARNYAFTQDKKWEMRYREVEPELDKIIKQAIRLGDKAFFSAVDQANLALVAMEYKAIELVNNGQAPEAVKILESDEYWDQKEHYEKGLRNYVLRKGIQYDEILAVSTHQIESLSRQTQELIRNGKKFVSVFVIIALIFPAAQGILALFHIISSEKK